MEVLLEGLPTLARVSQAQLKVDTVDLAEIARAIVDDLAASEPARRVEFIVPERLPVRGGKTLLISALQDLLGNAWKFTAKTPGVRIELNTRSADREKNFYVRDDGAGFRHGKRRKAVRNVRAAARRLRV